MKTKLKEKLSKLYELSKRGVDGEKLNAEVLLNKLLEKHNLTIQDIDVETPKERCYKYTTKLNKRIITQIIYKVINDERCVYGTIGCKEVSANITDYEHIQILEEIDFHLENFDKERKQFLDSFTSAYIQKHRLFKETTDEDLKKDEPLTYEEKIAIWRMSAIKDTLSNKTYTKKLK